jgi:hypothetical protein
MDDPAGSDGDCVHIELCEGLNLIMDVPPQWTPCMAFVQAWACSVLLKGKPVCLKGMLPGVTLHIATRLQLHSGLPGFIEAVWPHAFEQIQAWLQRAGRAPCFALSLPYSQAWVARSGHALPAAAVHIEWRHPSGNPLPPRTIRRENL